MAAQNHEVAMAKLEQRVETIAVHVQALSDDLKMAVGDIGRLKEFKVSMQTTCDQARRTDEDCHQDFERRILHVEKLAHENTTDHARIAEARDLIRLQNQMRLQTWMLLATLMGVAVSTAAVVMK